jgi:hypothetical protein
VVMDYCSCMTLFVITERGGRTFGTGENLTRTRETERAATYGTRTSCCVGTSKSTFITSSCSECHAYPVFQERDMQMFEQQQIHMERERNDAILLQQRQFLLSKRLCLI